MMGPCCRERRSEKPTKTRTILPKELKSSIGSWKNVKVMLTSLLKLLRPRLKGRKIAWVYSGRHF